VQEAVKDSDFRLFHFLFKNDLGYSTVKKNSVGTNRECRAGMIDGGEREIDAKES